MCCWNWSGIWTISHSISTKVVVQKVQQIELPYNSSEVASIVTSPLIMTPGQSYIRIFLARIVPIWDVKWVGWKVHQDSWTIARAEKPWEPHPNFTIEHSQRQNSVFNAITIFYIHFPIYNSCGESSHMSFKVQLWLWWDETINATFKNHLNNPHPRGIYLNFKLYVSFPNNFLRYLRVMQQYNGR